MRARHYMDLSMQKVKFMRQKIIPVLIILSFFISFFSYSQKTITGRVSDKNTHEPLEAAVISDSVNKVNTLTDRNGNFILRKAGNKSVITISYIGYISQKIETSTSGRLINIQLEKGSINLEDIIISSKINSIVSARTLSSLDLNMKPARSAQDMLRLVPGLFIAQQVGGGKAEQIFLRGFDADHGTDVNISVDGMPVNLVSQAHGQGWSDLHYLIPETVGSYDFGKGPY